MAKTVDELKQEYDSALLAYKLHTISYESLVTTLRRLQKDIEAAIHAEVEGFARDVKAL